MRIINVNARYPGSAHNSFIWNNSNIQPLLQELHNSGYNNYQLIGELIYDEHRLSFHQYIDDFFQ